MSSYWKTYWEKHVESVSSGDHFRQVLRVQNGQPMAESLFKNMLSHIISHMALSNNCSVLDLCCGNGLISAELAKYCRHVTGLDFSEKLVEEFALLGIGNVTGINVDVLNARFEPGSFDRILFAAAMQHFTQGEVILLFRNQAEWLKPGGRALITDILDSRRIWQFYNSDEREHAYFSNVMSDTPILGTWFDSLWLIKLAKYAGFRDAELIEQPDGYPYSHYRFDLLCKK